MPIDLRWYTPDAIFLATYTGHITRDDQNAAMRAFIVHLDATSHPVHLIVDWRGIKSEPFLADILNGAIAVVNHRHMGWITVLGMNSTLSYWVGILTKMTRLRYKPFNTLEAAVEFLQSLDNPEVRPLE